jgi:hypothetical protein
MAFRRPGQQPAPSKLESGLRYQEVRDDCQDQDYRHGEDDNSGHTAQPAVCPGPPKQYPGDDSCKQCDEDACADERCTNRQQMRRAQCRKTGRASPTRQGGLRYPKNEQSQKDDASRNCGRAHGAACLDGHFARLSISTPVARRQGKGQRAATLKPSRVKQRRRAPASPFSQEESEWSLD